MFQTWVLTRGTWTIPDVSWTGRPRRRTPGGLYGSRMIPLKPVTSTHGTLTIQLDPMHVMMQSANGTNVMGEVGGGYYFMHTIPPPPEDAVADLSDGRAGRWRSGGASSAAAVVELLRR
ncbi:hypothetical protein GS464_21160 [Rhodococcus hoagii]|nr:hypothetical protein [Prescottella equi]